MMVDSASLNKENMCMIHSIILKLSNKNFLLLLYFLRACSNLRCFYYVGGLKHFLAYYYKIINKHVYSLIQNWYGFISF